MRKQETIEIDGVKYTVHELSVREAMPLMKAADDEDQMEQQLRLITASVKVNGQPLKDAGDLGMGVYTQLATLTMKVNGLGDDSKN